MAEEAERLIDRALQASFEGGKAWLQKCSTAWCSTVSGIWFLPSTPPWNSRYCRRMSAMRGNPSPQMLVERAVEQSDRLRRRRHQRA